MNIEEIDVKVTSKHKTENRYKYEVEKDGEYEYIRSYRKHDILPNGRVVGDSPYIQIKHKYCNVVYEVKANNFINMNQRCGKCCQAYENSFAYYIEVELGEQLDKYWDFEKNTVNPYHISKGTEKKIWIKCQEKDYHESYEISCSNFIKGNRCPYCNTFASKKVHPKDSFAQYHIDNTDPDFLEKYWDYEKNKANPYEISPSSNKKVWIKCQNEEVNLLNGLMKKDYHGSYETSYNVFTSGKRCSNCYNRKVHPYDSFGYHHLDKAQSWHPDNNISPFRVANSSNKKYKFICRECGCEWIPSIDKVSSHSWCPRCNASKGERNILSFLSYYNINTIPQKEYDGLIGLKCGNLSYDFYLYEYNLLIEYQGRQHEKYISGFHKDYTDFKQQEEHDRLKREYAEKNGIRLLEIWYYDFDNIEEILKQQLKL